MKRWFGSLGLVWLVCVAGSATAKELHVLYDNYHQPVVICPNWHPWQLGSAATWHGGPVREIYVCPENGCNYLGTEYSYQDQGGCCDSCGRGGVRGSLYGRVIEFATPARTQAQRAAQPDLEKDETEQDPGGRHTYGAEFVPREQSGESRSGPRVGGRDALRSDYPGHARPSGSAIEQQDHQGDRQQAFAEPG